MIQWIIKIVTGLYLVWMAVSDIRRKQIPLVPGMICALGVTAMQLYGEVQVTEWLPGVLVGVFLYGVCAASRGQIGQGDAFVYLITGTALGFAGNVELLVISLLLASAAALYLLVVKRAAGKYRMPFLPFTAAAYGVVMFL